MWYTELQIDRQVAAYLGCSYFELVREPLYIRDYVWGALQAKRDADVWADEDRAFLEGR